MIGLIKPKTYDETKRCFYCCEDATEKTETSDRFVSSCEHCHSEYIRIKKRLGDEVRTSAQSRQKAVEVIACVGII